jgi:hypothetical protein
MILLDPKGLLWGKRLRKLSLKGRLYYPLILGLTNFYARIELDEPVILSQFGSFKDPDLTAENLAGWFKEYADAGLAFPYEPAINQTWVQFDTPVAMRRDFPTTEDNQSPAPPEPEYTSWLRSIHGKDWESYNLSGYQHTIAEKRSQAGRKGGTVSGEARRSKTNDATANEQGDVVVEGAVAGVVDGDGVGVEHLASVATATPAAPATKEKQDSHQTSLKTARPTATTSTGEAKNSGNPRSQGNTTPSSAVPPPAPTGDDEDYLVAMWDYLMQFNPHANSAKRPGKWRELWKKDFGDILAPENDELYINRDMNEVIEVICMSQQPALQKYNVRPNLLAEHFDDLRSQVNKLKEKKVWNPIWEKFVSLVDPKGNVFKEDEHDEPIEFLDDTKNISFDTEEDDELA